MYQDESMYVCASVHDPEEQAALELQIKEFGQTPRLLFAHPHPSRLNKRGTELVEEEVRTVGCTTEGLSRMDSCSSNSWISQGAGPSSLSSRDGDQEEWVHVSLPRSSGQGDGQVNGETRIRGEADAASLNLYVLWFL